MSGVVGEFATQVRVGQFDLQFTFGSVNFVAQSAVKLFRDEQLIAEWQEGRWPDPGFYDIMNVPVVRCNIVGDRLIELKFENGLTMQLVDDSDTYECMLISVDGEVWVI